MSSTKLSDRSHVTIEVMMKSVLHEPVRSLHGYVLLLHLMHNFVKHPLRHLALQILYLLGRLGLMVVSGRLRRSTLQNHFIRQVSGTTMQCHLKCFSLIQNSSHFSLA